MPMTPSIDLFNTSLFQKKGNQKNQKLIQNPPKKS
jgi:hypothetical protein